MTKFYLHEGDWVKYRTGSRSKTRQGVLLIRPYGRRLWGAVRDGNTGLVHVVPKRSLILAVLNRPDHDLIHPRAARSLKKLTEARA